ncbi:MAG: DUF4160 domain-containing protein [Rhizobiaceae bacterium]
MFWDDHNPPHFHAVYGDDEVVITISTLEILRSDLPRRACHWSLNGRKITGRSCWRTGHYASGTRCRKRSLRFVEPTVRVEGPLAY